MASRDDKVNLELVADTRAELDESGGSGAAASSTLEAVASPMLVVELERVICRPKFAMRIIAYDVRSTTASRNDAP